MRRVDVSWGGDDTRSALRLRRGRGTGGNDGTRLDPPSSPPGVEFSWQGSDEGDEVSGRGWAALNPDGTLEGHIYFHLGDDSAFRAERFSGVVQ